MTRPKRDYTIKQLDAVLRGHYGKATPIVFALARQLQDELLLSHDIRESAARATAEAAKREHDLTRLRPEYERVLVKITRPLAEGGLPALEIHADTRVKVRVELPDDKPSRDFQGVEQVYPSVHCLPQYLYGFRPEEE